MIAAGGGKKWDGAPPGTTMGHVHLHVGTLEGADAFYHRALGFDKTVWSYPGALFLSAGGYHHHLGTNIWSPGPAPSADGHGSSSGTFWCHPQMTSPTSSGAFKAGGHTVEETGDGVTAADPWGTRLRIRAAG